MDYRASSLTQTLSPFGQLRVLEAGLVALRNRHCAAQCVSPCCAGVPEL